MRAVVSLAAALVVLTLAGVGCTAEDPTQRAVRERVQEHVEGLEGYDASKTRCSLGSGQAKLGASGQG